MDESSKSKRTETHEFWEEDVAYAGGIDRLYVHSPDRLARKYAYQVLLVDELKRSGVEIVFLNHSLGATPEEDLLLQVQGMITSGSRRGRG